MSNIIILLVGFPIGLWIIRYTLTRTEENFLRKDNPRLRNYEILNKKAFLTAYKAEFVLIGIFIMAMSVLFQINLISIKAVYICFFVIFLLQSAADRFIKSKWCRKR